MKTLKMLVEVENSKIYVYSYDNTNCIEVENSKIYVYSYDSLCASDTVNL